MTDHSGFNFPYRIEEFLRMLALKYEKKGRSNSLRLVVNAKYKLIEGVESDNWNGGTYGHDLELLLPEILYLEIADKREAFADAIRSDINEIGKAVQNEYIRNVFIGLQENQEVDWRARHDSVLIAQEKSVPENAVQRIWGLGGRARVFLSHKVEYKKETEQLKEALSQFGASAFVAHTSIKPTKEWLSEIEKALLTMDFFVVLLTDNFRDSEWTDQEVGVAIARGVPILTIKLGDNEAHGFLGKFQWKQGSFDNISQIALDVFTALIDSGPLSDKLKQATITVFQNSNNFYESMDFVNKILPCFPSLTADQIEQIQKAYDENEQVHGCHVVNRDLPRRLFQITQRKFIIENGKLISI